MRKQGAASRRAGFLSAAAGLVVVLVSFAVELPTALPAAVGKAAGPLLVGLGMALVLWAAAHLRAAFGQRAGPGVAVLVRAGPYRYVRHPIYLGMTVALAGVALAARSWLGLLLVFLLFLPAEIHRARLEEEGLRRRFGAQWREYAAQTGFMLPRLGRR